MKIFISYAHVNFVRIKQLADLLQMGGHDVWYDQRLVGGQPWKEQLRSQIRASACFIYALTPESIASLWCQWEFAQAVHMGKKIVTVLLQACDREGVLDEHQYVDFTAGDSLEAGLRLGTAVFAAQPIPPERVPLLPAPDDIKPEREITHAPPAQMPLAQQLYDEALQLYRKKAYTEAQELVDDLLHVAPDHVDARQLSGLLICKLGTRGLLPAPFDWIEIPGKGYSIAKYPVTNAQFARFIEAGGYRERQWWTEAGWLQRKQSGWKKPHYWSDSKWNGALYPVVGVTWYEAVAFCLWLSNVTGERIMLPTEDQWQYAARGDDGRMYPWGNTWDCTRCNNSVEPCKSSGTTPVTQYEGKNKGNSTFGVVDMAGNVWEWCLTDYINKTNDMNSNASQRVLCGGSWNHDLADRFRCVYQTGGDPNHWYDTRGFRVSRS